MSANSRKAMSIVQTDYTSILLLSYFVKMWQIELGYFRRLGIWKFVYVLRSF